MGRLVLAMAMSHVNPMGYGYDEAEVRQNKAVMQAIAQVERRLREVRPDVLLVVGSDHVRSFFLDNVPPFCLGTATAFEGWQERGLPLYRVAGHQPMARFILEQALESGFDLSFSEELRLDHAFFMPLHFLTPAMDIPLIPLVQNCTIPPMAPIRRSVQMGQLLRRAVEAWPGPERVAILGTGGLSHWVGVPGMGRINEAFDRAFLDDLKVANIAGMAEYRTAWVDEHGGNGGQEIRNWVAVRAAAPDFRPTVLAYEPVPEWVTGFGVALFDGGVERTA